MILKLSDLIINKELELPYIFQTPNMEQELKNKFDFYKSNIRNIVSENIYNKIVLVCDEILKCVQLYYNGEPQKAYANFELNFTHIIENSFYFQDKRVHEEVNKFYRIRTSTEILSERKDIFHISFSERRKVVSYRYSISGHPSLYLSTSIDVCRIETNVDYDSKGIVGAFKFKEIEKIRVLDFTKKIKHLDVDSLLVNNFTKEVKDYLIIYPLIAACSIKKFEDKANFIPEYIIPQLLMQWLRSKSKSNRIYGIKYFTTRARNPKIKGFNFVFPTNYSGLNENYCNKLSNEILVSNPVYFESLRQSELLESKLNNSEFDTIVN